MLVVTLVALAVITVGMVGMVGMVGSLDTVLARASSSAGGERGGFESLNDWAVPIAGNSRTSLNTASSL